MNSALKNRFFIALLPSPEVQQLATKIKNDFAEIYNSKAALKSPPHVTLQPPFTWELKDLPLLKESLKVLARQYGSIPIVLDGFAVFAPRVIYIKVQRTPELLGLQKALEISLEKDFGIRNMSSKSRCFCPHMTVGFRDLTVDNFHKAWAEYQYKPFAFEFNVNALTLLQHDGTRWQSEDNYSFSVDSIGLSSKTIPS
ncbi:MAG: RNA 2',3'-cyclic phosphodiesterase [Chroococcopsis gigantea SAG 12.99]|jgi:2'-5' RNA ligase|nr:2'-5' RNA ligase family protein [Chlorogloea purpurea SAG 13.99]MDV2999258.1 RNA 2',3'-cyclic phosphodiesterase [Chroococcopsis gigantea SAG 12.99]